MGSTEGNWTLRTQDTFAPVRKCPEDTSALVRCWSVRTVWPKDTSPLVHGHFSTTAECRWNSVLERRRTSDWLTWPHHAAAEPFDRSAAPTRHGGAVIGVEIRLLFYLFRSPRAKCTSTRIRSHFLTFNGRCYFPSLWMENSPVCHFCLSTGTDKSGQCTQFFVYRISLFLLLFSHKRPSSFFYICPTKKTLF